MARTSPRLLVALAAIQGTFYAATGVWGLVDLDSFQFVTGPKNDLWLVRAVSVLVLAIGGVLMVAAARLHVAFELVLLAMGSALGLSIIDVVYATAGTIRDVYLLDAAIEVAFALAWGYALWRFRNDLTLWGGELHGRGADPPIPPRSGGPAKRRAGEP